MIKEDSGATQLPASTYVQSRIRYFSELLESDAIVSVSAVRQLSRHLGHLRDGASGIEFDGQNVTVEALHDPTLRARLSDVEIALESQNSEKIKAAYNRFSQESVKAYANSIDQLEQKRFLLKAAILGALLALLLWSCWRQMRAERIARRAWNKSQSLLSAIIDGALILDNEGSVVAQNAQITHSSLLPGICIGSHFLNFLSPMLDETVLHGFREDLYSLLEEGGGNDPESRQRSIVLELNAASNKKATQFLKLKLSKCYWLSEPSDTDLGHILLVVNNVDEQVETQQTLEVAMRLQKSRPSQVVKAVYSVPSEVRRFLARSKMAEHDIEHILRGHEGEATSRNDSLITIGRLSKSALDDAKNIGLDLFVEAWSDFVEIHSQFKAKRVLSERALTRMQAKLTDIHQLRKYLQAMLPMMSAANTYREQYGHETDIKDLDAIEQMSHDLVDAYASFSESFSAEASVNDVIDQYLEGRPEEKGLSLRDHFAVLAQNVASREGKKLEIYFQGLDEFDSTHMYFLLLSEVGVELLRNSIEHGLEIELDRIMTHKERLGRIDVELFERDDKLCLSVRDDGKGLDFSCIRSAAIKLGWVDRRDTNLDRSVLVAVSSRIICPRQMFKAALI